MSLDTLGELNWVAVLVAALAYWMLGAIWYARPVFGDSWMKAQGIEMPEGEGPPLISMIGPLVGYFIVTIAVGMIAAASGTDTAAEGLALGLTMGIGVAGAIVGVIALFEANKPSASTWALITGAYNLLGLVLASIILAVWN